jgi:hypothetical protein
LGLFSSWIGSLSQSRILGLDTSFLGNEPGYFLQILKIKSPAVSHVVDGAAPGEHFAVTVNCLVPDTDYEGLCITMHRVPSPDGSHATCFSERKSAG